MSTYAFPTLEPEGALVVAGGTTPLSRAAEIVQQAQAEAGQIRAAAEAEGRERGYADGVAAAQADLADARQALDATIAGIASSRDELLVQVEQRAGELAVALAAKIIGTALDLSPELVVENVAGALRRVDGARDRVVVEVNGEDAPFVAAAADSLQEQFAMSIDVVSERRVPRGGAVVRTEEAEIDARIATQLERAQSIIRDALATGHDG
jgi:flagellar assembly protein FliH